MQKVNVLFVCLGNICRSPAAEALLRQLASKHAGLEIYVESCGLGNWHQGKLPDPRMCEAAAARGVHLTSRAQEFRLEFLDVFDLILAADRSVLDVLKKAAGTPEKQNKITLMTAFSKLYQDSDVPDPYHLTGAAFDRVLDILEDSCKGLLFKIQKNG